MNKPICIECGSVARITTGREVYPGHPQFHEKRYWKCPKCADAYCGCHPGSTMPLGGPAGRKTREARAFAHGAFDTLWKSPSAEMSRSEAYQWLADEMGLPAAQCHIGMMTEQEAHRVAALAERKIFSTLFDMD